MRKLLNIKLIALLLLMTLNIAPSSAAADSEWSTMPAAMASKFEALDFVQGALPDLSLFMYNRDEVIDLGKRTKIRLAVKSKPLYKSKEPIASFKADMYEILPGGERLFVGSQTLNVDKRTKTPAIFYMDLNKFDTNYKNVEIDLFDTAYNLVNTYRTQLSATNLGAQGQDVKDPVPDAVCDSNKFGECQLDYIFSRLVFEARPQKQISTRVIKGDEGNYTITFPVARKEFSQFTGSTLTKGAGGYSIQSNVVSNGTLFLSPNGTAMHYNEELNQLEFNFPGHEGTSAVLTHDSRFGLGVAEPTAFLEIRNGDGTYAPLKFNAADLLPAAPNGAVEYDGHKLFITVDGVRQALAFGSEVESAHSSLVLTGNVDDDQLPSTMADKTINNLTVTGNFVFAGGSPSAGKFLTTDANGNASWATVSGGSGGATALQVLAHTINGYAINGSQATVQGLSSSKTLLNALAILERNAQIDRADIALVQIDVDSLETGLADGSVDVALAGDITGVANGAVINGIAMYAKQLKRGHSAGTFSPGAGTVTNGDTLLGALQKIVGNTNTNTTNIATNTTNITTHSTNIAQIQTDIAAGNVIVRAHGDITGLSSSYSINGVPLFAKQLKSGHSTGLFTPAAGTITNGDTILGAFQKIVGNVNTNTTSINSLSSDVSDLMAGTNGFTLAGDITGMTNASVINGLSLYAKQLKTSATNGVFTPVTGTVTNGDTLVGALKKIVGNTNVNTSNIAVNAANIATNTASIASHSTTLSAHTATIASHTSTLNNLLNGDQAIPIYGDLVGYTNGVTLNGFALFEKQLKDGNGLALFTPGPGNQTVSNGDTLIRALEKIAGNIDRSEADIITTAILVASHAGTLASHTATLASHTTSINTLTSGLSDVVNGDSVLPLVGEIGGNTGATTINGVSMYAKMLKRAASNGLFTPGAGTVTNGDTLVAALQKIVGNVNTNTSDISSHATTLASHTASIASHATTLTSHTATLAAHSTSINSLTTNVSNLMNGDQAIPIAGDIDGDSGATVINGISLFTKQLKVGVASGLFTPGAGTVTNGDTLLGALQKMVGNTNQNSSDISSHATTLAAHATTLASHTATLATHTADISDIRNGGISLAFAGEITGWINGAVINGVAMYDKRLSEANGATFTPGPGNQTITNADTLHSALQKIAGNVDLNEATIASHSATISSHTTSINANTQNISDLANGDDAFTQLTLSQTGNADVLLANNNGFMEVNGRRVITVGEIPGIDPQEAINVANGTAVVATVDYTDVDGNGTAATAIRLTSDKIGGSSVTLVLGTVGPNLVPTSYVINGVQTNFSTVPSSLVNAFSVPDQDYKVYVTGNKVRIVNVDPFSGLLGGVHYSKKTIRATYSAFFE